MDEGRALWRKLAFRAVLWTPDGELAENTKLAKKLRVNLCHRYSCNSWLIFSPLSPDSCLLSPVSCPLRGKIFSIFFIFSLDFLTHHFWPDFKGLLIFVQNTFFFAFFLQFFAFFPDFSQLLQLTSFALNYFLHNGL